MCLYVSDSSCFLTLEIAILLGDGWGFPSLNSSLLPRFGQRMHIIRLLGTRSLIDFYALLQDSEITEQLRVLKYNTRTSLLETLIRLE